MVLCVFDVNETLLDVANLDKALGGADRCREWFALTIHTALTTTATGTYRDFAGIAADAAAALAARDGLPFGDAEREAIGTGLRSLPAHPDVHKGLERLREAGATIVALTNSPKATAEAQLKNSGLEKHFDRVFSAEQAGRLKPAPAPYRHVLEAMGTEDAVMIAAHDWDIEGARAAGLKTALLARPGVRPLPGTPAPDYTAAGLPALADAILR